MLLSRAADDRHTVIPATIEGVTARRDGFGDHSRSRFRDPLG